MLSGIAAGAALFGGLIFLVVASNNNQPSASDQSVTQENGVQIIRVAARGGYSPRRIVAKSGMPTRLELETKGSYDCSTAFTMPTLGIRKQLPATGITNINIPPQESGAVLRGLCSMGMYSFDIQFN